jgi:two-component system, NarL family, nitrate/nitrite response regulator NarL
MPCADEALADILQRADVHFDAHAHFSVRRHRATAILLRGIWQQNVHVTGSALIIDDHPLYRDALAQLLGAMLGGEASVRVASSAEEGLRMASQLAGLQLVLLDFNLPGMSGTEAIGALLGKYPTAIVVAVSASEERVDAAAALRAGAKLFISKAVGTDVMSAAIRRVLDGDFTGTQWITPSCNGVLAPGATLLLTQRQLEILALLHLSNKEIGLRLGVAEITVKMHVSSVFRVLGVANRTQAMQAARRLSLVSGS